MCRYLSTSEDGTRFPGTEVDIVVNCPELVLRTKMDVLKNEEGLLIVELSPQLKFRYPQCQSLANMLYFSRRQESKNILVCYFLLHKITLRIPLI